MSDTTQEQYDNSTKALAVLPQIALLLTSYDPTEITRLAKKFSELQENSIELGGFKRWFHGDAISAPTKLADGTKLLVSTVIIKSHIESEIDDKKRLQAVYDDVRNAYLSLQKTDDGTNKINSIVITDTINQLANIAKNDAFNLISLNSDLEKLSTLEGQLKVFISQAKEEGKIMSADQIKSSIMNDNADGVLSTIRAYLWMLKNILKNQSSSDWGFREETSSTVIPIGESEHTYLAKTYNRTKDIFENSPQKSIPILPLLNLVYATGSARTDAVNDPSINQSQKQEIANKSISLIVLLCKQINKYLDNISTMQKQKFDKTIDNLGKAMADYQAPDLSKFTDEPDSIEKEMKSESESEMDLTKLRSFDDYFADMNDNSIDDISDDSKY